MISFWKTIEGKLQRLDDIEDDCWVNMANPNDVEIRKVAESAGVDPMILRAALDEEEISYVGVTDDGHTFMTMDIPIVDSGNVMYSTIPLGILITGSHMITVCLKESTIISDFANNPPKNPDTFKKTKFMLTLMLRVANRYLQYLRQINKISTSIEEKLYVSQRNKEVVELLNMQKSLVFFNTSLKANQLTLEKIMRGKTLTLTEEDTDTLEDVLIEIRQAIEMSTVYTDISAGTMDALASMISNNLNAIMKALTVITLILTIPTMVFSYYGMNLEPLHLLPFNDVAWFPLLLAVMLMVLLGYFFKRFYFSKKR